VAVWMAVDCLVRLVRRALRRRRWRRAAERAPEPSLLDLIGAASPPEGSLRKWSTIFPLRRSVAEPRVAFLGGMHAGH